MAPTPAVSQLSAFSFAKVMPDVPMRTRTLKIKRQPEKIMFQRDRPPKRPGTPGIGPERNRGELRQPTPREKYRYHMPAQAAIDLGVRTVHTGASFLGFGAPLEQLPQRRMRTPRVKGNERVYMEHNFQVRRRDDDGPYVTMHADLRAALHWKKSLQTLRPKVEAREEERSKARFERLTTEKAYSLKKKALKEKLKAQWWVKYQGLSDEWMDATPAAPEISADAAEASSSTDVDDRQGTLSPKPARALSF